jgi:hypothetical protein
MSITRIRRCFQLDWAIYLHELELRVFGGPKIQLNNPQPPAAELDFQTLLGKTKHSHSAVREQAAKELAASSHPAAPQALIELLKDGSHSVSWTASHSLVSLRRMAVRPLLEELTRDFQSSCFLKAVRHIFNELNRIGDLTEHEVLGLHSLMHDEKGLVIAHAANKALISTHSANP